MLTQVHGTELHATEAPTARHANSVSAEFVNPDQVRLRLSELGIEYGATYVFETFGVLSGGINGRQHYHSLLDISTDIDFGKLAGWPALTFHANAYRSDGTSITLESSGTIAAVSHIEATPTTRLFEAWFEQRFFDGKASLRFGQLSADAEFATLDSSTAFVSSTFGWNTLMTDNLPNGGPIYPLATPGIRLRLEPTEQIAAMVALYNGDPVGLCDGDPQSCNSHGTDFRLVDPPLVMVELAYRFSAVLPGSVKLGGWHSSATFDDLHFDAHGVTLASPASSDVAKNHHGNHGFYGVIHQMIYQSSSPDKGVHLFSRVAGSPSDRNQIDLYVEGGLTVSGLWDIRPDDVFGLGIAYSRISDSAAALDRDSRDFIGDLGPIRNYELLLELSYTANLATGWTLQPDLQYYWNPGGNIASPGEHQRSIDNALILGLRTTVKY